MVQILFSMTLYYRLRQHVTERDEQDSEVAPQHQEAGPADEAPPDDLRVLP